MKLPELNIINTTKEMINVFGGYNHNIKIGDGEFYNMENLTSDDYPVLSVRKKRGELLIFPIFEQPLNPSAITYSKALYWVDHSEFVYMAHRVDMGLSDELPKQLILMGDYIIIMPDKKYISTSTLKWGYIEAGCTMDEVTFSLCQADGNEYENIITQNTAPSNPQNKDLWIDTSNVPHTLKQYYEETDTWTTIVDTYIKISCKSCLYYDGELKSGDGIKLVGIDDQELSYLNNSNFIVKDVGELYVVIKGMLDKVSESASLTIRRNMPEIKYFCEAGNRLWGVSANGHEIYASKLGDFTNWNCFEGISTDSYAVTVGSHGNFTGAFNYQDKPIFFKENCIYKIYGNYPSNYQLQHTVCDGVAPGSNRSLAVVNGVLYYKSPYGICAYDGSFPTDISSKLGNIRYSNAVACGFNNKYYISMENNEQYHLFVYDTSKRVWHREDNTRFYDVCIYSESTDILYLEKPGGKIRSMFCNTYITPYTEIIKWMAETGEQYTDSPYKKYISRIDVRIDLEFNTTVRFFVEYDSSGKWDLVYTATGEKLQNVSIPLKTRRCGHLKLRIEGEGKAKIYSITKTIEQGSNI